MAGEIDFAEAAGDSRLPRRAIARPAGAAYRIRRRYFGNTVQLYFLMNAKSGLCPEDCGYCSQSKVSEAEIPRYNLLNRNKLLDGAGLAAERQAKTYCIVISARGPTQREMDAITRIVPEIKQRCNLKICACLGLLTRRTGPAAEGLRRRSREPQPEHQRGLLRKICSTHTYQDRVDTLAAVRERRHGAVLGRHPRHGRSGRRRGADGLRPARLGRRIDPGEFPEPDRRHAAGRRARGSTRAIA